MKVPERIAKIYLKNLFANSTNEIENENKFFQNLLSMGVRKNSILIIEPNNCHCECLPSYVRYFLQAGFNVDVFISEKNMKENSFINTHFPNDRFRIFYFQKLYSLPSFFEFLNNYKYILIASLTYFGVINQDYGYYVRLLKENYLEKYNKNNLYLISHEVDYTEQTAEMEEYYKDKTFVLRPNIRKSSMTKDFPFIVPTYFGEFGDVRKNKKENYARFLCIGGAYKKNLRNYDTLLSTIKSLSINYANQFELIYVGNPDKDFEEKVKLNNVNIRFTGRVNFADLYKYVIETDFILFNIDKNSVEYERYLNKKISGSYSLSLGFLRPGIIDSKLSKAYDLDNCAITYSDEKLYEAMEKAIKLKNNEYAEMEKHLNELNNTLRNDSLMNIKEHFNA